MPDEDVSGKHTCRTARLWTNDITSKNLMFRQMMLYEMPTAPDHSCMMSSEILDAPDLHHMTSDEISCGITVKGIYRWVICSKYAIQSILY